MRALGSCLELHIGLAGTDEAYTATEGCRAADLDQIGVYGALSDAVESAAAELDAHDAISTESWDAVAAAVGPGPLAIEVETLRD